VQGFFSLRIYRLSHKLAIPMIIWVGTLVRLAVSIMAFVLAVETTSIIAYVTQWQWAPNLFWSVSTANDVMITATLAILLHHQRAN
ncbi:hypothetical protein B0H19DRAFT_858740, partial [Mycena capillaripes]